MLKIQFLVQAGEMRLQNQCMYAYAFKGLSTGSPACGTLSVTSMFSAIASMVWR